MYTSFTHYEECLIFQCVGKIDISELQAPEPSRHLYLTQCVEYLSELLYRIVIIILWFNTPEAVELLIIIVLYLPADSSKQTVTLACLMLTTTLILYQFFWLGNLTYLTSLKHRLQSLIAKMANYGGHNT